MKSLSLSLHCMNRYKLTIIFAICSLIMANASARDYVVPPSETTYTSVPVISDAEMEQCVILYNEAKWLRDEIDKTVVDKYSERSVASYNNKIATFNGMNSSFNSICAGKQSQSAYNAAQRLNDKTR